MKKPYRVERKDFPATPLDIRRGLQLAGGGLIVVPLCFLFPIVGAGSGKSYELGSDMERLFSLALLASSPSRIVALAAIGLGIVLLIMSCFAT